MGVGASLDAETAEAKTILADFTTTFAKNYTLLYTVALAKLQQKKMMKQNNWKLLKCDYEAEAPVRFKGHVLKRSNFFKKWNKRYLVVRGNYVLDFYENEGDYTAGKKPRATFNLSGFNRVDTDPNNNAIAKLTALAEKAGLDLSSLPMPEKLPDNTMVCEASGRPSLILQTIEENGATAEANFKTVSSTLDRCWWLSPYMNVEDDEAHSMCFRQALWRTSWDLGFWTYWCGGGEEAMLTSTIARMIEWRVMDKVDGKLTMPWPVRQKIRNTFLSTIFSTVSGAVKPFWSGLYDTIKGTARPQAEEALKPLSSELATNTTTLKTKITEAVNDAAKDVMSEKVEPKLGQAMENLFSPVNDAFQIIVGVYDDIIGSAKTDYKTDEKRLGLVRKHSWSSKRWDAEYKLRDMYDLLWALGLIFDEIWPWSIINRGSRRLGKNLKNALFTFETRLEEAGGVEHWDTVAAEVRTLLVADCQRSVSTFGARILIMAVLPMWEKLVIQPCKKLVAPIASLIPEPVKLFIDVNDLLVDVLYSMLKAVCTAGFEPFANRIKIE